jgi:transposase
MKPASRYSRSQVETRPANPGCGCKPVGPPDRKVVLFDYTSSHAQEVRLLLLESYRGYVMTDDYAGYNALALQPGVERLACMAHARRKFVDAQEVQPKGKTGRADIISR